MAISIDFSSLPAQSKLFLDFLGQAEPIRKRFSPLSEPRTATLHADRERVEQAIRRSMECVPLSLQQELALEGFRHNAAVMATGQQVGFLGGPLYTLFKIQTALHQARQLSRTLPDARPSAVAVFWLEDNDHDAKEAGVAWLPAKELGLYEVSASENIEVTQRRPVSELSFDGGITERINNLLAVLPETLHKAQTEELLHRIYSPGRTWTDAFILLLQEMFAEDGLLILKASVARESGLMADIIRQDLNNPGLLEGCVLKASDELASQGYHAQAKPSPLNIFVHVDHQRHKINNVPGESNNYTAGSVLYSYSELQRIAATAPERFSPSVLLRPIVQDYILGTHSYIAGPGEIAYLAQVRECYEAVDVAMPHIVARYSATALPRRVARFMEKQQRSFHYFLRPWQEVEKETLHTLHGTEIAEQIEGAKKQIHAVLEALKTTVKSVDATLEATVGSTYRTVEKEFETIAKKVNAALKRRTEQSFGKFREAAACIFPEASLQERKVSPIFLYNECGIAGIRSLLAELEKLQPQQHHILELGLESEKAKQA